MRLMKHACLSLLLAGLYTGSHAQQQEVVIKGTVIGDTRGYNRMDLYSRYPDRYDSLKIVHNTFTITYSFEAPYRQLFASQYDMEVKDGYAPQGILIDKPGTYNIIARIDSNGTHYSATNGDAQQVFAAFAADQDKASDAAEKTIMQKYGADVFAKREPNPAAEADLTSLTNAATSRLVKQYVGKNPGSYAAAIILQRNSGAVDSKTLESLYQRLTPAIKSLREAKDVATEISARKLSTVGSTPADFTLKNGDEQPVKLSAFRGKYLLIDFWASWCGPCRAAFPHMRELYAKYKDKNFEILSISTDRDKAAWLKAMKEENNPWPQAHDGQGTVSKKQFNVQLLPTLYLISPEGKIIAQKPDEAAIDKKLAAIFGI
ncbi:TlpA family protein disulfide reductase [Chitinophaga solisilvae]|uniref:TlpA family protein disulfide reductase n=1 Tax=Chitinophaga solisilvae TaxID=1233460 RepID=UPI00136AB73C|nr:TlpA disulfide reductase family protein [Chitinophaga solisilvae]